MTQDPGKSETQAGWKEIAIGTLLVVAFVGILLYVNAFASIGGALLIGAGAGAVALLLKARK